jgi:hypothetical protein
MRRCMVVLSVYAEWFLHHRFHGVNTSTLPWLCFIIQPCVPFLGDHHCLAIPNLDDDATVEVWADRCQVVGDAIQIFQHRSCSATC